MSGRSLRSAAKSTLRAIPIIERYIHAAEDIPRLYEDIRVKSDEIASIRAEQCAERIEHEHEILKLKNELDLLSNKIELLNENLANLQTWVAPGHFYSPIFKPNGPRAKGQTGSLVPAISGIDLNIEPQLNIIKELAVFYPEQPFTAKPTAECRYYFENDQFSYTDALILHLMLRRYKPKRVIEIGSGFSSALMLDTSERYFPEGIELVFIDPFTERLRSLVGESPPSNVSIIQKPVQEVDLSLFESLEPGDVLFIDSSHVSKTDSDVNWLFFQVLPKLPTGVLVHVHDIHFPFEYPVAWIEQGRSWNENYFLQAFLMYNSRWKIMLWPSCLHRLHPEFMRSIMPLTTKNRGGSIWLKSV